MKVMRLVGAPNSLYGLTNCPKIYTESVLLTQNLMFPNHFSLKIKKG